MYGLRYSRQNLSLKDRFLKLNYVYILLIIMLAGIGTMTLYSAANGNWHPWAV